MTIHRREKNLENSINVMFLYRSRTNKRIHSKCALSLGFLNYLKLCWFLTSLPLTALPLRCVITICCFMICSSQRPRRFGVSPSGISRRPAIGPYFRVFFLKCNFFPITFCFKLKYSMIITDANGSEYIAYTSRFHIESALKNVKFELFASILLALFQEAHFPKGIK